MANGLVVIGATALLDADSVDPDGCASARLGYLVTRGAETLPSAGTYPLFTITGGQVLVTSIVGQVGTVIQTQACNLKLQGNPTASGSSVDLCADLNISAKVASSLFSITGAVADAMLNGLAVVGQTTPQVLQSGTIDWVLSATNSGSIAWLLRYVPLTAGARVVVYP